MELSSAAEEHWNDGALDVRLSSARHSLLRIFLLMLWDCFSFRTSVY